jgi:hypothetical protein
LQRAEVAATESEIVKEVPGAVMVVGMNLI